MIILDGPHAGYETDDELIWSLRHTVHRKLLPEDAFVMASQVVYCFLAEGEVYYDNKVPRYGSHDFVMKHVADEQTKLDILASLLKGSL